MLVWLSDSIEDLLLSPRALKFFRKTHCTNGFLWILKTTNKRGSFIEITNVLNSGGKANIVVPAGEGFKGWSDFRSLLLDFLNGFEMKRKVKTEPKLATSQRQSKSYAEALNPSSHKRKETPTQRREVRLLASRNKDLSLPLLFRADKRISLKSSSDFRRCSRFKE